MNDTVLKMIPPVHFLSLYDTVLKIIPRVNFLSVNMLYRKLKNNPNVFQIPSVFQFLPFYHHSS